MLAGGDKHAFSLHRQDHPPSRGGQPWFQAAAADQKGRLATKCAAWRVPPLWLDDVVMMERVWGRRRACTSLFES